MHRTSSIVVLATTLLALGSACQPNAGEPVASNRGANEVNKRPRVWPKPTPPPDASPVYHDLTERVPTEEEIARDAHGRNAQLQANIENALRGSDAQQREAAAVFLLPELLQVESARVLEILARQPAGASRDLLINDVARIWVAQDVQAATSWMKTLPAEERRDAGIAAVTALLPFEPATALRLARDLDLEDDHSLRKLLSAVRH